MKRLFWSSSASKWRGKVVVGRSLAVARFAAEGSTGGTAGTEGVDRLRGGFGRAPLYLDMLRAIVVFVVGKGARAAEM